MKTNAIAYCVLMGPKRAFRSGPARVFCHYVVHEEEFADSVHTVAHDVEHRDRTLGYRLLKKIPHFFSPPGQRLPFQVFEKRQTGHDA